MHSTAGVFTVDAALVDAINAVDPSITVATLARHATVEKGQMVATVKIIPFAVAGRLVDKVTELCATREIFAVNPFVPKRVGVIQTVLPSVKQSVLDKTSRLTEAAAGALGQPARRPSGARPMTRPKLPRRQRCWPATTTWW